MTVVFLKTAPYGGVTILRAECDATPGSGWILYQVRWFGADRVRESCFVAADNGHMRPVKNRYEPKTAFAEISEVLQS